MEYSLQQQNNMTSEEKVIQLKKRIKEMKMIVNGELPDGRKEPSLDFTTNKPVPTHSDVDALKAKLLGRK